MRRLYHWLMIWPCLWIGALHSRENWFSEESAVHWLKSRKIFYGVPLLPCAYCGELVPACESPKHVAECPAAIRQLEVHRESLSKPPFTL